MPFPRTYVDALLINWGDRLFPEPFRHVGAQHLPHAFARASATDLRERLKLTLRGAPEVIVKITNKGKGGQGFGAVRRHLNYISRNGCVELEDQDGHLIAGRAALDSLIETWYLGGWGIADEGRLRQTLNMVLSMPEGTDRQGVRNAAREFARQTFGDGRPYVFVQHDDEAHPHVHLCVHMRGPDGRRLNPRRQDLERWRDAFAHELRAQGIDANSTRRVVRGQTRRATKQAVTHMLLRGAWAANRSTTPDHDNRLTMWHAHIGTLTVWREIAQALANSEAREDRVMALKTVEFVRNMPVCELSPEVRPQDVPRTDLVLRERLRSPDRQRVGELPKRRSDSDFQPYRTDSSPDIER